MAQRGRRAFAAKLLGAGMTVLLLAGCAVPRWPTEGPLTSPFGLRSRAGQTLPSVHHGVDLGAPHGAIVRAALSGRVRFAGEMRGYGQVIWLEHRGQALTVYGHLSEIQVRTGETVRKGQPIGRVGATGNVSGPHLHFEVWKGGRPVDPVQALGRRP